MEDNAAGFVNTSNTRPGVYDAVISQIAKDKVCPFCPDQLLAYHKNPILAENTYWLATDNMYPYKDTKTHLLFIHKEHVINISEVPQKAWEELQVLANEFIKNRNIPGGTLLMRFGETKYTGASVNHLHAHVISSDPDRENYTPLMVRVG